MGRSGVFVAVDPKSDRLLVSLYNRHLSKTVFIICWVDKANPAYVLIKTE